MEASKLSGRGRGWIAPPGLWVPLGVHWPNYYARESSVVIWKRLLAWTLLVLAVALLLGITAFGVICIGAGLGTIDSGGIVMIFMGALLLVLPGSAVWFCVSRWRANGSLRTSPQE